MATGASEPLIEHDSSSPTYHWRKAGFKPGGETGGSLCFGIIASPQASRKRTFPGRNLPSRKTGVWKLCWNLLPKLAWKPIPNHRIRGLCWYCWWLKSGSPVDVVDICKYLQCVSLSTTPAGLAVFCPSQGETKIWFVEARGVLSMVRVKRYALRWGRDTKLMSALAGDHTVWFHHLVMFM